LKIGTRAFRSRFVFALAVAVLSVTLFLAAAAAQQPTAPPQMILTLDPAQTKVHWNVDSTLHLVHGTFALKSGSLRFDPQSGKADGELVVFAPSGESGSAARDKRMHKEILETAKFPEVVFRPTQVEGPVAPAGSSEVKLHGIFSIHGSDHPLEAQVHAELAGSHWTGTAKFEVPYVDWGIKDPSNFLLKVKPVVNVEIEMSGLVASGK
jgi:polyisoprenoid-binding protein YceI